MLKIRHTLLIASMLTTGTVLAETSKFQGAFGQIGIGYESISPNHASSTLTVNRISIPVSTSSNSTGSGVATISLGWYQNVAKGFLLGAGVEYSPFAGSTGDMYVSTVRPLPGQNNITNDYKYQKKYSYNIFLSPAVMVGTDGLAYAKVGFTGAQLTNYNSLTYNLQGYSLGLGYKHMFKSGWYGFVEANYASYGKETQSATNPLPGGRSLTATGTNGLTSYNILAGVGYKF